MKGALLVREPSEHPRPLPTMSLINVYPHSPIGNLQYIIIMIIIRCPHVIFDIT